MVSKTENRNNKRTILVIESTKPMGKLLFLSNFLYFYAMPKPETGLIKIN